MDVDLGYVIHLMNEELLIASRDWSTCMGKRAINPTPNDSVTLIN